MGSLTFTMNPMLLKTICCILFFTHQTRSKVVYVLEGENGLNGLGEKVSELEENISKLADKDSELEKKVFKLENKVSNFTKEENNTLGWEVLDGKKKKFVCFCWTGQYICGDGEQKPRETESCEEGNYKTFQE